MKIPDHFFRRLLTLFLAAALAAGCGISNEHGQSGKTEAAETDYSETGYSETDYSETDYSETDSSDPDNSDALNSDTLNADALNSAPGNTDIDYSNPDYSYPETGLAEAGNALKPGIPDAFELAAVSPFSGTVWADVNGDVPFFEETEMEAARRMVTVLSQGPAAQTADPAADDTADYAADKTADAEERQKSEACQAYGDLDELGRCTGACALVGPETLPREERGNIGMIKPTGWHTVKYDGIEGNYLYNRCHLIGFQLTGQDANEKNLITGTRYLNVEGMLPYEDSVLAYVTGTGNHVLYRVTPVFQKDNLLADGVLMEARSVEDPLVQFCAFCYNVQPGITIDYATGESTGPAFTGNDSNGNGDGKSRDEGDGDTSAGISSGGGGKEESPSAGISSGGGGKEESPSAGISSSGGGKEESPSAGNTVTRSGQSGREETSGKTETPGERMRNGDWRFIVNVSTGKFHLPGCESVRKMSEKNKQGFNGSREELIEMGYEPCKNCNP